MDLFINTSSKDLTTAAVASASDFTALDTLTDLPQLVAERTEPFTVKFLSSSNTYESWSASPTYTVRLALGLITADGTQDFAEATLSTIVANGKSGALDLTPDTVTAAMRSACVGYGRKSSARFVLEVLVTDDAGKVRTWAQLPVRVNGLVKL